MTTDTKNKAFKIFVNALKEATNELKKHLSSKQIPCSFILKEKTERVQFWNDAITKLSKTKTTN